MAALAITLAAGAAQAVDGPGFGNLTYSASEATGTAPIRIVTSTCGDGTSRNNSHVWMHRGYLYAVTGKDSGNAGGGLEVYDFSNPKDPRVVFKKCDSATSPMREAHRYGFWRNDADGKEWLATGTTKGIMIWDVTNAQAPAIKWDITLSGIQASDYDRGTWWVEWQAPYIYVAGSANGLYILNATNVASAAPTVTKKIETSALGDFRTNVMQVVGNVMITGGADTGKGFASFDLSDPLTPVLRAKKAMTDTTYTWVLAGKTSNPGQLFAYTRFPTGNNGEEGFHVWDLTGLGQTIPTAATTTAWASDKVGYGVLQDNYVHFGLSDRYGKINVNNHSNITLDKQGLTTVSGSDQDFATAIGNVVWVGNDHDTSDKDGSAIYAHQAAPDTTPPAVSFISPNPGATNQKTTVRVGVIMTDSIDFRSVNSTNFIVRPVGGSAIAGKYSGQFNVVHFAPNAAFTNGNYEVVINGLKDWAGNTMTTAYTTTFVVGTGASTPPAACSLGTDTVQNTGTNITFTVTGCTGTAPLEYSFDFGDGSAPTAFSTTANATKNYSSPLHYQVVVTVRNSVGSTTASRRQTVIYAPTATKPTRSTPVFYDDLNTPTNYADDRIVVVNPDRNSVRSIKTSILNDSQPSVATVDSATNSWQMNVGRNPRTLAVKPGSSRQLWVVSQDDASIRVLNADTGAHIGIITLQPGSRPYGIAFNPAGTLAWVSLEGSGEVIAIDASTSFDGFGYASTNPIAVKVSVGFKVRGLAVSSDGARILATRNISSATAGGGQVIEIAATTTTTGTVAVAGNGDQFNLDVSAAPGANAWAGKTIRFNGNRERMIAANSAADPSLVTMTAGMGARGWVNAVTGTTLTFDVVTAPAANAYNNKKIRFANGIERTVTANTAADPSVITFNGTALTAGEQAAVLNKRAVLFDLPPTGAASVLTYSVVRTTLIAQDSASVDSESSGRGLPNYLQSITISPSGKSAAVPSKTDNVFRGTFRDGKQLNFENTVRTVVSIMDLQNNPATDIMAYRRDINNSDMANSAVYTSNGDWIFIAQHNNKISLYDALNYNANTMIDIDTTGITPQGLAIKPDNQRLYVWNFMSRTIDTVDITAVGTSNAFPLKSSVSAQTTELLAANILAGKKIFYNATDPRMARDEYIACSTCHLEGGADETVFDFTDGGEGLRNTITLLGRRGMGHGPVHWSANFDEIQDFEHPIRSLFGGTGFMSNTNFNSGTRNTPLGDTKAGLSTELDNMAAYVASLSVVPMSPYRNTNGTLTAAGEAGRVAFNAKNCASCHSGRDFTDSVSRARHDVGTMAAGSGNRLGGTLDGIDTPSLLGIWNTAPYLHNGSAATLAAVLTNEAHVGVLTAQEQSDIASYLNQIDDVGRDVVASNLVVNDTAMANEWSFQPHIGQGDYAYGDRAYIWTTVPALLADAAWLRPANDSKLYSGAAVASFNVNVSTDVYMANDDRWLTHALCPSGACPWFAGYTDTTQDMLLTEPSGTVRTYSIYKKTFAPGAVSLPPINNNGNAMYVVVLKATPAAAVPAAPTGLAAIPGDRTVTLSWSASSGANTYTVQRSTASGTGFANIVTGLGSTSYGDTGRTNGITYFYRVAAVNGAGTSGWSSEASATPTCSVLDAPSGLTATPGQAQASLSWNAVAGATGYNVKRSTTSTTDPATVQSLATNVFTNTGLAAGTTYYFRVSATNSCGESPNSTEVSVTPTAISAKNAAMIVKDQDTGTAGVQLSAGDTATQSHLVDLGFTVTAYDHAGLGTDGSDEASGKQVVFIASSVSSGNIANKFDTVAVPVVVAECLVWDDMRMSNVACTELNNFNTLHVENASSPLAAALTGDPVITTAPAALQGSPWLASADNVFSIPGDATKSALFAYESGVALASGTAPARRVAFFFSSLTGATETATVANATAWDIFGASANWATGIGMAIPAAPTNLGVTGGFAQATLTWTGSPGATSYRIKRSVTSGSGYSLVGNATGTSYLDSGVANGQTYYYVVVATNAAGDSANSNQVSVTPNCTLAGVPAGLTATAGTGSVSVSWGAVSAANSYNVKRSTTSGSGYGTIASGVTTAQYVDTSVAVGTTYYYVVSSNNACGESANSTQVSSGSSGSSTTSTVAPAADAYVRMGGSAGSNFGTATTMEVKNDDANTNTRQTYLRFSLSGIGATVTSAKVRIYGNAVTAAKAMAIYAVSDFAWSETGITWNNKPAIGAKQGSSVTISTTAGWWEFDVTSYVQARKTAGDGGVSFAFQNDAASTNSPSSFQSKEGANDPQLVIIHQ